MADRTEGCARAAMHGLRRSFAIYYRDRARTERMDRLNSAFVQPGDLVFDIGAHLGDRTGSVLRLGARVVALEPQTRPYRALRRIYGRCARATLLQVAAGAAVGEAELLLNRANPTVATVAPDFVAAATGAPGWEREVWDDRVTVPVTTLDALVVRHGPPGFVKIDVEGHEAEVLGGLSQPLQCLSFEVTTIHRSAGIACIERLAAFGRYEYNLSLGETHTLRLSTWLEPEAMARLIDALPNEANSGDVYARRVAGP